MSDLVGNPEDRFSDVAAHMMFKQFAHSPYLPGIPDKGSKDLICGV